MKHLLKTALIFIATMLFAMIGEAQCSICAKTASQMGEDAGRGLNGGILYLAAAPFLILSYIGYRWWKSNNND